MFGKRENRNTLEPPPIANKDPNSREVLRVWAVPGGTQEISLKTTWADPGTWGLMLVDLARHAANAYAHEGHDREEALSRIRLFFESEWDEPTDDAKEVSYEHDET